jgi:hypothetical protein
MNGNITKAGITADLEAMKQIGLGGATIVNVDCEIPRGPVAFMSPEWREDFKFAVQEADRLGLKLCVENCAGWSSSGGPWNTVTNAMQRLTCSETIAHGPARFDAVLPQPPTTLGFYRDVAVLAFQTASTEPGSGQPAGKLVIQSAVFEARNHSASADVTDRINALIQCGQRSLIVACDELGGDPAAGHHKQLRVKYTIDGQPGTATANEWETLQFPLNAQQQATVRPIARTSVDETFVRPPPARAAAGAAAIDPKNIMELTAKLAPDGRLQWDIPPGNWVILRVGYTPTGVENHPSPAEGLGLECDKLSRAGLDEHWNGFMRKVLADLGPLAGKALDTSLIDSYEVGGQDWTAAFRKEFQKRRGYDPVKFLPVFARYIVDSPAVSERFQWDLRRTVADLFAENYFGYFAKLCRRNGLLNATEPYTGPFESLQCGAPADVVMGEFWSGSQGHPSVKMAASIAHIYGKTIVGAESFTAAPDAGRWLNDPYSLKTLGDLAYCQGLNRYIFHRYALQPWTNRWPGMTMGQWGFCFERTVTWWDQGKPWIDYISRCQFLLQQGRAVADAAYFTGETAPVEMRAGNPRLPAGYDYDAVNADVLLHGASVKHDRLTLASGASYAALILSPEDSEMTPQLLRQLRKLVRAGATVVGGRPHRSPSLAGYPACDTEVKALANELWGPDDGAAVLENRVGKGRVIQGKPLAEVFSAQSLAPDFSFAGSEDHGRLAFAHRQSGQTDIYFVSNQRRQFDSVQCTFRIAGKAPELWHPDTGIIEPAPVWSQQGGTTRVRLDFEPAGSVFVIFRPAVAGIDPVASIYATVAANETAPAPKLLIQRATYAAIDGAGTHDATAAVSRLVNDGQRAISVNNDLVGADPAFNHVKELRVDYTLDGAPGRAVAREGEMLALPGGYGSGQPPATEPTTINGQPAVRLWANGNAELRRASGVVLRASAAGLPPVQEVAGAWKLSFPPNWGAPASVNLDQLISWTEHADSGVRYFSGTAAYEKDFEVAPAQLSNGRELWLDLGAVKNFAEIELNGQSLGVLWKPPFRVNATRAARAGANRLVVKVTNLWPNRLIGDEQLPPDTEWNGKQLKAWPQWLLEGKSSPTGRLTFTTWHHWYKDSPLLESGLLGPVTLHTAEVIPAK